MHQPRDTIVVLKAFRLGWYMAEVRGRNRPNSPQRDERYLPGGDYRPLPLRVERTATERRIEAQGVLTELAIRLYVDEDGHGGSYGKRVDQDACHLDKSRHAPNQQQSVLDQQWKDLAEVLWDFDAHIQDELTARSEIQACAYQLGRGLAETYWALDPFESGQAHGWTFLLGERRCAELGRLIGRISAYLNIYTGSAVVGSIEIWKEFARGAAFDAKDPEQVKSAMAAQEAMHGQIRRWYELIVLGQDPTTLIRPFDMLSSVRMLKQAVRQFWPQVAFTAIGLGCLGTFLAMVTFGGGSELVKTLGVTLGTAGLSIGGVTGALKNSAQSLLVRLRQDTYTELITEGVIVQPPAMSRAAMRQAVAGRRLTPITPG